MKSVLAKLRQKGHINSGFIDDLYLQGQEFSDCTVNLSDTHSETIFFLRHDVMYSGEYDVCVATLSVYPHRLYSASPLPHPRDRMA